MPDWTLILVGIAGIGIMISLLGFIIESILHDKEDRIIFKKKARPWFLAFILLTMIFGLGIYVTTYTPLATMIEWGLLVLAIVAAIIYVWPNGLSDQ